MVCQKVQLIERRKTVSELLFEKDTRIAELEAALERARLLAITGSRVGVAWGSKKYLPWSTT